jgi:hypothetical protein
LPGLDTTCNQSLFPSQVAANKHRQYIRLHFDYNSITM